jgi:thioredoxin 1
MSVLTITKANFETEVLKNEKPVLLDFWASWCGPCRMVSPIVEEIAQENPQICVGKVNVDEEMDLAREFGVMSIPTLVVIREGKPTSKTVGACSKGELLQMLELSRHHEDTNREG